MSDQDMLPDSGEGPAPIAPAEIPPPVPEDLLGLRIGAALIDLALLGGLFTILSAAVRQTTVSGEGFKRLPQRSVAGCFRSRGAGVLLRPRSLGRADPG